MKNHLCKLLIPGLILLSSCTSNIIEGLWVVEEVKVGEEKMTPVARWTRFNKDHSQFSGNGWTQHSIGTWEFDATTKQLRVINTNGYIDPAGPFTVRLEKDRMYWNRTEEGQQVEVTLQRSKEIPASPGDQLLGVWDLERVTESGKDISDIYDPENKRYLFLRWDKLFTIQHSPSGRLTGIYRVHAHRPEIEMIFYQQDKPVEKWKFQVGPDRLELISPDAKHDIKMEYRRINYFPQ